MREIIIAGNWKMYKTGAEAVALVTELKKGLDMADLPTVVVCPPFTALGEVNRIIEDSVIKLGAQNMFWKEEGAYTGEISPRMLIALGCKFVILGHSERRIHFGETDCDINRKIKCALSSGIRPIVCCGERLEERERGEAKAVVEKQIRGVFSGIDQEEMVKCIIAYEPVWAIGTGKTATPGEAEEMHLFIRNLLAGMYSSDVSSSMSILYGGSVKPENIKELMGEEDIDGALVGGASLKPDSFLKIVGYGENK